MIQSPLAFYTYTEFFLHVKNICYFLESENFQHKVELSVSSLQSSIITAIGALIELRNLSNDITQNV